MSEARKLQLLVAPGCSQCQRTKSLVRKVAASFDRNLLRYEEIDVIEALDYAVALGITRTPSIVLDGELLFVSTPTESRLRNAIQDRLQL